MAINEKQHLSGRLTIELRSQDGRLMARRQHDNLITTVGKMLVARLFTSEPAGKPQFLIAVGDSAAPAMATDKKLGNVLDQQDANATVHPVNREGGAAVTVTATFPALATGKSQVLREAGILIRFTNQEPVLYNRVNFGEITRTDNLEMTLTWEVLF